REGEEGGGGGDFEEARTEVLTEVEDFLEQRSQLGIRDQLSGNPDALVVAHQVRLDGGVDAEPFGFENRAQVSARRALAVGPGDMKHRRQAQLRIAEPGE